MTDRISPFAEYDPETTVALRWTLRDIAARRSMLLPYDPNHLDILVERGLVELQDGDPVLTSAGRDTL